MVLPFLFGRLAAFPFLHGGAADKGQRVGNGQTVPARLAPYFAPACHCKGKTLGGMQACKNRLGAPVCEILRRSGRLACLFVSFLRLAILLKTARPLLPCLGRVSRGEMRRQPVHAEHTRPGWCYQVLPGRLWFGVFVHKTAGFFKVGAAGYLKICGNYLAELWHGYT